MAQFKRQKQLRTGSLQGVRSFAGQSTIGRYKKVYFAQTMMHLSYGRTGEGRGIFLPSSDGLVSDGRMRLLLFVFIFLLYYFCLAI